MFHYTPASSLNPRYTSPASNYYRPQPVSARDKYLSAVAEAKAAEAEYLAAEAAQREEEALHRRLQELRFQRQQDEGLLLASRFDRVQAYDTHPYAYSTSAPSLPLGAYTQDRPAFGYDHLATLRHQIEEEERVRLSLARRDREEREREAIRRQAEEEAHLLLTLKRQEDERQLLQLHRQQEEKQRALALHKLRQAQAASRSHEQSVLLGNRPIQPPQQAPRPSSCRANRSQGCRKQTQEVDLDQVIHSLISNGPKALLAQQQQKSAHRAPEAHAQVDVQELLNHLFGGGQPAEPKQHAPAPDVKARQSPRPEAEGIQQFLNFVHAAVPEVAEQLASQAPAPQPKPVVDQPGAETLQQILGLLFGGAPVTTKEALSPHPSSSRPQPNGAKAEGLEQILNLVFGGDPQTAADKEEQHFQPKPYPEVATPSPAPKFASATSSLKEQLEARLNNEYAIEVRDTIQAVLASLSDSPTLPVPAQHGPSSTAVSSSNHKGKSKEMPTSAPENPTSKDVVQSMDTVRNIEAAFHVLESEFIFPTQIDFVNTSVASRSPASSDSESSAARLAFTSRNHPVRFYEQALTALLAQLDSVDSFGNETLRGMRKEVVGRVEKALEELERELDGRWKVRAAKESKSVKIEVSSPIVSKPDVLEAAPASSGSVPDAIKSVETVPELSADAEATSSPVVRVEELAEVETTSSPVADNLNLTSDAVLSSNSPPSASAVHISGESQTIPELSQGGHSNPANVAESFSSYPPQSLSASVATIRPYDTEPADAEPESVDTFLLPAQSITAPAGTHLKPASAESQDDAGSDWSEVDA